MLRSRAGLAVVGGNRSFSRLVPSKATWDLIPRKADTDGKQHIDFGKLEKLSMLSIDIKMKKDLETVIDVAERMCNLALSANSNVKPLIHYNYLGKCQLREDEAKISSQPIENASDASLRLAQNGRQELMKNAKYKYDDYFIGPPPPPVVSQSEQQ